jgi:hypothetical protein
MGEVDSTKIKRVGRGQARRNRYNARKEATMIELTEQQAQALENPGVMPPRIVNPRTNEAFVLLRIEEYERLKEESYDDSPWTREELQALAWERVKNEDWEEYNGPPRSNSSLQFYGSLRTQILQANPRQ